MVFQDTRGPSQAGNAVPSVKTIRIDGIHSRNTEEAEKTHIKHIKWVWPLALSVNVCKSSVNALRSTPPLGCSVSPLRSRAVLGVVAVHSWRCDLGVDAHQRPSSPVHRNSTDDLGCGSRETTSLWSLRGGPRGINPWPWP